MSYELARPKFTIQVYIAYSSAVIGEQEALRDIRPLKSFPVALAASFPSGVSD